MGFRGRKSSMKNPPILSHEFVIQNHGDIVSCIALFFVIGLLIQTTSPLAYMFVVVQHNVTLPGQPEDVTYFTSGWKDICAVFFYFLFCIVIHALVQEYVLDKITRKLHLSKVKHSLFNESGQLVVFYALSVLWGADLIFRENYIFNIASLWEGYPHAEMSFLFKFFYIIQLSYWLHCYPELYFQKVKKEEIPNKVKFASANLAFVLLAYIFNFTRVGLCLIVLHYLSEVIFHGARLWDFAGKNEKGSQVGYLVSKIVFVLVRLGSIILSVLTFWYGLSLSENQGLNFSTGNYNTQFIRMAALLAVGSLQAYLMWNFITSQLARIRELSSIRQPLKKKQEKKLDKKQEKKQEKKLEKIQEKLEKTLEKKPEKKQEKKPEKKQEKKLEKKQEKKPDKKQDKKPEKKLEKKPEKKEDKKLEKTPTKKQDMKQNKNQIVPKKDNKRLNASDIKSLPEVDQNTAKKQKVKPTKKVK